MPSPITRITTLEPRETAAFLGCIRDIRASKNKVAAEIKYFVAWLN
jgi:hypothetical protein